MKNSYWEISITLSALMLSPMGVLTRKNAHARSEKASHIYWILKEKHKTREILYLIMHTQEKKRKVLASNNIS